MNCLTKLESLNRLDNVKKEHPLLTNQMPCPLLLCGLALFFLLFAQYFWLRRQDGRSRVYHEVVNLCTFVKSNS